MNTLRRLSVFFVLALAALIFSGGFSPAQAPSPEAGESVLNEAEEREQRVIERFWTLLEKTPRRGVPLDRVYGYYVDTGRLETLLQRCRNLTETKPDDPNAWLLEGLILARRGDDDGAARALEKAAALAPMDPNASFHLGEVYIAQGRLRDATAALEQAVQRALTRSTGDAGAAAAKDLLVYLQTLGRVYERFGDQEKSTEVWNRLEELFPGDLEILVRIAETLEEEGKFDEALARYQKLAEKATGDNYARVQYTLAAADIKIRLGEKQQALDDFETLLEELSGESWLAQTIRDRVERIFVRQADYAGLAGYYRNRLEKHPNELDTVRRLAVALVRLSRNEEAAELLEKTLEKAPANIPLRLALIDLHVAAGDFDAVDRHYAEIDKIQPNNPDYVSQWGLAVLENRKLDETARKNRAVAIWNRLIAARPNDPSTIVMVADLANSSRIPEEAERLYKAAVELRPAEPGYKEYLGYFYHHRNRSEEAVVTLRGIAEGNLKTAGNLAQLGGIFRSLGYTEESLAAYREAVELAPKDFELRMQLASQLLTAEQFDAAEEQLVAAEKLAAPLSEEFARYLAAWTKMLQATEKIEAAATALENALDGNENALPVDHWRLALYRAAQGRLGSATESIEKALERKPGASILLESAADLFEKAGDPLRAAGVYEQLAKVDPQRRVDHLKRLARLQQELGEMDKAIETARLVMATGAGNAANSRFYADMLLGIGRRSDGIEALRRAVRLDPTDTTTLSALSDVLFESDEIDEALEILWRIFDRTEDLQGKIAAVSRMSTYYQQSQRFDQFVERLRSLGKDAASRREAVYCLAQAYVTVSDFDAARQTLEMLLLGVEQREEGKSTDDVLLLSQLSKVSELQGDLSSAIRYQEMLCDQSPTSEENLRLLGLYQQGGEEEKSVDFMLKNIVEKGELRDRIQSVDDLLAREDYELAGRFLERIERKNGDHWEVLYRRMMLDYWTKNLDGAEQVAARVLALEIPRDELSAKKQHEMQGQKSANAAAGRRGRIRNISYGGDSPWRFGDYHFGGYYYNHDGGIKGRWMQVAGEMLPVLFREKLSLERYYYQRGMSSMTNSPPAKPQSIPETFGDLRFAVQLWQLKFAMDRDIEAFRAAHPAEEGKPAIAPTRTAGFKLARMTDAVGKLRLSLPLDSNDVDIVKNRLRLEYTFEAWSNQLQHNTQTFSEGNFNAVFFTPVDGPELEQYNQRKQAAEKARTEKAKEASGDKDEDGKEETPSEETVALLAPAGPTVTTTTTTASGSTVTVVAQLGGPLPVYNPVTSAEETEIAFASHDFYQLRNRLEYRLAVLGEAEWFPQAYQRVVGELAQKHRVGKFRRFDVGKEFDRRTAEMPEDFRKEFSDEKIARAREILAGLVAKAIEQSEHIEIKSGEVGEMTEDQKVNLIFRCWEMALTPDGDMNRHANRFHMVLYGRRNTVQALRNAGRDAEAERLETIFAKAVEDNPVFLLFTFNDVSDDVPPGGAEGFLEIVPMIEHAVFHEGSGSLPQEEREELEELGPLFQRLLAREASVVAEGDFPRLETIKKQTAVRRRQVAKIREAFSSEKNMQRLRQSGMEYQYTEIVSGNWFEDTLDWPVRECMQSVLTSLELNENLHEIMYGQSLRGIRVVSPSLVIGDDADGDNATETDEADKPEKKLSREQLDTLTAGEKRIYDCLEFYFQTAEELDAENKQAPPKPASPAPAKPKLPSLGAYRDYFEHSGNTIETREIDNLLEGRPMGTYIHSRVREDRLFTALDRFFETLDENLKGFKPGEDVEASELRRDYRDVYVKYLKSKETGGTPFLRQRAALTLAMLSKNGADRTAMAEKEVGTEEKYKQLKQAEKLSTEKGEASDPRRLLALALLARQSGEPGQAIRYLDALPLTNPADMRLREVFALNFFNEETENAEMKNRAETAVDKLLGFQLPGKELLQLRQTLQTMGRATDADRIRERLLVTATDLGTQVQLLGELRSGDEEMQRRAVSYALRIFRSPAVRSALSGAQNDYARHVRDQVLDVLKQAGKLGEIVEQIESQWKSSPGSIDIMTALVDIYHKAGRKADAEKIAREIGEKLPDDPARMRAYATLLRNIGMNLESAEWMQKALEKNPEQLFQNFWEYENSFRQSGGVVKLIELLRKIEPVKLADNFGQISHRVFDWLREEGTKQAAMELIDYVWAMEGVDETKKEQARYNFLRSMIYRAGEYEALYPMFRETVFKQVSPLDAASDGDPSVSNTDLSPFSVYTWSNQQPISVAGTFFEQAEKKKLLEELLKEFEEIVTAHEAIDKSKRSVIRYRDARLCVAFCRLRLGQLDEGLALIEAACAKNERGERLDNTGIDALLGMELSRYDTPKAIAAAIRRLESVLKRDSDGQNIEMNIVSPLYALYFKTDKAERGLELAVAKLRECFDMLRHCGGNYSFNVGNRHYDVYNLQQSALSLCQILSKNGYDFELMTVLQGRYVGKPWVELSRRHYNYRYDQLDQEARSLDGKIPFRDFVGKFERLVPGLNRDVPPSRAPENAEEYAEMMKADLPVVLGAYVKKPEETGLPTATAQADPYRQLLVGTTPLMPATPMEDDAVARPEPVAEADFPNSLAGIRFLEALKVIAADADRRERYEKIKAAILRLDEFSDEDPSVLVALACAAMVEGDAEAKVASLKKITAWIAGPGDDGKPAVSEQIALGCWGLVKEVLADPEFSKNTEARAACVTILGFLGERSKVLEIPVPRHSGGEADTSRVTVFITDVQRTLPVDLAPHFRPDFLDRQYERPLLGTSGQLTRRLDMNRRNVAGQYRQGIELGAAKPVLKGFEKVFENGWPKLEGGGSLARTHSYYLLYVFQETLDAAKKNDVDPEIVYESLLKIVLSEQGGGGIFLAEYADLGGENGYFRTAGADLVDWALAAGKTEELRAKLAERRELWQSDKAKLARLSALELILAVRTGDDRAAALVKEFSDGIREGDADREKLALVAAMPCVKPFEFSEITEAYPRLIELIDAGVASGEKDNRNRRYVFYIIRSLYDRFEKDAPLEGKLTWLRRYRAVANVDQMDGFRFTAEDRLFKEGLAAIEAGRPGDALKILRYFADCPENHFRYRNLSDYLDALAASLDVLPGTEKQALLGDFDLSKVARQSGASRTEGWKEGIAAGDFGLPPLPEGTMVYRNDFETETGPCWSMDRRDTIKRVDQTFLGEFHAENLRFTLPGLPDHRFVRIRFDLLLLGGADGLVGLSSEFGVDVWGMRIEGGAAPVISTFSNFHKDPNNQKQSFPDDYPPEFGVTPSWYSKVLDGDIWGDELEKGFYYGRHGAVKENEFGYEKDALYAVDIVVPHRDAELAVDFFTRFQDGPYGDGAMSLAYGESWGLDNFRVDLIDKPLELTEEQLETCFAALIGDDAVKAAAARWRLVASENKGVKFIDRWFGDERNAARAKSIRVPGNFDLFRIDRVLELIATPEAETLRKKIAL